MYKKDLNNLIDYKKSYLCITLNYTEEQIKCFGQDMSVYDFIKKIIDTTSEYVIAYRINYGFYQNHNMIDVFEKIIVYINNKRILLILDLYLQKNIFLKKSFVQFVLEMSSQISFSVFALNLIREDAPDFVLKNPEDIRMQNMVLSILGKKDANSDASEIYECIKEIYNMLDPTSDYMDYIFIVNDIDDIQYARKMLSDDFVVINNIITQKQLMYCIYQNMTNKNWGVIIDDTDQIIVNSPNFFASVLTKTKETQKNMESIITLLTK